MGRHADLLSRHEIGAAISHGRRSRLLARRAGGDGGRAHPRPRRGCRRTRRDRVAGTAGGHRQRAAALEKNAPVLHAVLGDNLAFRKVIDTGGVDAAFAASDTIVEGTFEFARHTAVSSSLRIVLARLRQAHAAADALSSSQVPHMIQTVFARTLGVPEHNVRVVAPDVGGSFGLKIHTYGDEIAATAAAMVLGRPVKFVADRLEFFVSDIHAREKPHPCAHGGEPERRDPGARNRRPVRRGRLFAVSPHQRVRGKPDSQHHGRPLQAQALSRQGQRRLFEQGADLAVSRRRPPHRQLGGRGAGGLGGAGDRARSRGECAGGMSCRTTAIPGSPRRASRSPTCRTSTASIRSFTAWTMRRCGRSRRRCARRTSIAASALPRSSRARRPARAVITGPAVRRSLRRMPAPSSSSLAAASSAR